MTADESVVGEVVDDSPLTISINGGEAAPTMKVGDWTPTIGMRVAVVLNAETKARKWALGEIT